MTLTRYPSRHQRRPRARRLALLLGCATALGALAGFAPAIGLVIGQSAAAVETQLSETGWVASTNTSPGSGDAPANAIDGNISTRFSTDADQASGMYFQVNMGSSQTFNQIEMNSGGSTGDYARGFNVEVSTNGSTFTSVTTGTGTSSPETVTFTAQTAQYIRVVLTTGVTTNWWSIAEFTVYNGIPEIQLSRTGWVASTNTSPGSGDAPANAIDGNISTRFSTDADQASGMYFQVNMGSSQTFNQIEMDSGGSTGDYARGFNVEVSTNGSTFTSVTTGTGTSSPETVSFAQQTAQYIRVVLTTGVTTNWWSIAEFTVYTQASGGGNTVTVTNPGTQNSVTGTAVSLQIGATDSASGQTLTFTATGLPAGLSISSSGLITGTPTTAATSTVTVTAKDSTGASGSTTFSWIVSAPGSCPTQSNTPNLGPNVDIFDPSMSNSSIQTTLNNVFNTQKLNQFGTQRFALLFKPGTYSVEANIGYYTSIAGLGQNPDDVMINGDVTVDAFDGTGNATQNFWRSAENLAITPSAGSDRWAVAQAGPFRRIDVHGGMNLAPASNGFASGGYIADTKVSGQVTSVSQQQWYSRDSNFGSWNGSVWNMVFSGVNGAPAQSFPSPPMTTLATTPVSRDVPYLYVDSSGNYHVFLPSLRTNASGPSWASGPTPGTSVPMSQFFVADPSMSAATINTALSEGCNLLFTPGVYNINQTLNVTHADTTILGIGFPTLIPQNGVNTMQIADVNGVRVKGLLFDAGTTNSAALLTVGTAGSTASHASDPISIQDVFFRIGGDIAGQATDSLVVNANDTIVDDIWAWRADHGNSGTVGWTVNTANNGMTVNGNNVIATGLFVEHYQKTEVQWNGQNGKIIFFQNEMPYDPPNQAAWMNGTQNGYPAIAVASNVTSFGGWGLGSYCFFNVNNTVNSLNAYESPNVAGVAWHDLLTVSLGNKGSITHVINNTGAVTPTNSTPSDVVSYP